MKKFFAFIFESANEYVRQSDWRDLAMLKCCLAAIGVLIGLLLPRRCRRGAFLVAGGVFAATYVPLMSKYIRIVLQNRGKNMEGNNELGL